jgi:SAM-dependent methyltransferase
MVERALSFGAVASAYEEFRPGYPEDVVDAVLAYAGRPLATALEIGAGTGKATRLFARRGVAVTATDPDPAMLTELRRHVPPTVVTIQAAFEDLPPADYDLVFAAASLHWTRPEGRWARVAAMLKPHGIFASFGGPFSVADEDIADALVEVWSPFLASEEIPSPDGTPVGSPLQWPGTELELSEHFTDVVQSSIPRRLRLSRHDYIGQLATVSAYLGLVPATREQVFGLMLEVLPPEIEVVADITVHLARRR